jgi:hypothetical protein
MPIALDVIAYKKTMKPKEVVVNAVNAHLLERMKGEGFEFSEAQLKFKRKLKNGFVQEMLFRGSKNNMSNFIIDFHLIYLISSPAYKKWWQANFPDIPVIGAGQVPIDRIENKKLSGARNNELQPSFGYDFMKFKADIIMDDIWNSYLNHGRNFFEVHDNWDKIADKDQIVGWQKIDAFIFAGRLADALELATYWINTLLNEHGNEENIPVTYSQFYQILNARVKYIKEKLAIT